MTGGHTLVWLAADYWWVPVVAWIFVLGPLGRWNQRRVRARREHQVRMAEMRARVAEARRPATVNMLAPEPAPGRCRHRHCVSVRDRVSDEVIGWLCRDCDTQLPADWSVYPEEP